MKFLLLAFLSVLFFLFASSAYAVTDPLSVPNNKFGIHLIQATDNEASPAAELVNQNGDWGYVTVVIGEDDRKINKWQTFFDDLRRRHLIPLIRLSTRAEGNNWQRPRESDALDWALFLNSLNWPTQNRYVIVYNEPNHASEWGGVVDPVGYAQVLDTIIKAFKKTSPDFFMINGGFDASSPQQPPAYFDEVEFLKQMEKSVPGIFDELDGWSSHSYPNPGFTGSPEATGRGTVGTWAWELGILKELGLKKNLPVFITETGWKHAEGQTYDRFLPEADTVAGYFKTAFESSWSDPRIVTVTPFLLEYQEPPFDHFSFKKPESDKNSRSGFSDKILGAEYPFYPSFTVLKELKKAAGRPVQINSFKLIGGGIYRTLVAGQSYPVKLEVLNTGQSIWNDGTPVKLVFTWSGSRLNIQTLDIPVNTKVEPGQKYSFNFQVKSPQAGLVKAEANLYAGDNPFSQLPMEFQSEVKSPVILKVTGGLQWKNNPSGNYILSIAGPLDKNEIVNLDEGGISPEIQALYLLPDYDFTFTLQKPYYKPSTIHRLLKPGVNVLNFGKLQPDLWSVILNPMQLWKLLRFGP